MFYIHRSIHPAVVTVAVAVAHANAPARPLARSLAPRGRLTPSTESRRDATPSSNAPALASAGQKKKIHTLMETARVADTAVAVVVVLVVAYIVLSESDVESPGASVVRRTEEEERREGRLRDR